MIGLCSKTAPRVVVLLGVVLSSSIDAPEAEAQQGAGRPVRLVEGRFGQALDAAAGGYLATADPRFSRMPLTVELWAKLADAGREAILLSNEGRDSGTHWELVAEKGTGALLLRVPGFRPPRLGLNASLADGRWHHVALVLQEGRARAYFDGRACQDAPLARTDRPSLPSGLGVGTAVEDRRPNPVLIDDVRISDVARDVVAAPSSALVADEHTVALWSFDESEDAYLARWTPGGETNQRGLPYPHRFAEYEFEKDEHWADGRWQQTDKGPFVAHSIVIPRRAVGPKGIAVFLDRTRTSAVLFDPERCAAVAGLVGARLTTSELRHGLLRKPSLDGALQFYVPPEKTWRKTGPDGLVPLGRDEVDYRGLHLHGDRVLLSYRVLGGQVLDLSSEERRGEVVAIARHLEVDGPSHKIWLTAAEMPAPPALRYEGGVPMAVAVAGEAAHAVALVETSPGGEVEVRDRDVMVRVPAGVRWKGQLLSWSGPKDRLGAFAELARSRPASPASPASASPVPGGGASPWSRGGNWPRRGATPPT